MKKILLATIIAGCSGAPDLGEVRQASIPIDHRNESTGGDVWEPLSVASLGMKPLALTANTTYSLTTRNCSLGADPVMHLLNTSYHEVAYDDDSGGNLMPAISYRPTTTGGYIVLLRTSIATASAHCDIYVNNALTFSAVSFGNTSRRYSNLRPNELLTSVQLRNTAGAIRFYLLDSAGRHITASIAPSADQSVHYLVPAAETLVLLLGSNDGGSIRIIRNDAALIDHDQDNDALGDELESALGTCSNLTQFAGTYDCSRSADPRDTDGDGLSDSLELYGYLYSAPYQYLPRWGANPLHKDIFVEVDTQLTTQYPTDYQLTDSVAKDVAQGMADAYGDVATTDAVFQLLHAQQLNNPDGTPGIRLHLDNGWPNGDGTNFGNWGGHNAVAAPDPQTAYANGNLMPNRRGIFHYALVHHDGGGQNGFGITTGFTYHDVWVATHEFGHSLNLQHYGPTTHPDQPNCKVSYPSLMSYAPSALNALPGTFSDGYGRPGFNNVSLPEVGALDPSQPRHREMLTRLQEVFGYPIDMPTGSVDWNRDGQYSSVPVRAYANNAPTTQTAGGCEYTHRHLSTVDTSFLRPALSRLNGEAWVFTINTSGQVIGHHAPWSAVDCSAALDQRCDAPFSWFYLTDPANSGIVAVDAQRVIDNGQEKLLVYLLNGAGTVTEIPVSISGGVPVAGAASRLAILHAVTTDFAVTGRTDEQWLISKDPAGNVYLKHRQNRVWGADLLPSGGLPGSLPLAAQQSPTALEIPDGTLYAAFGNPLPQVYTYDRANNTWINSISGGPDQEVYGRPALVWQPWPAGLGMTGRLFMYWSPLVPGNIATPAPLRESWVTQTITATATVQSFGFTAYQNNIWFNAYGVDALDENMSASDTLDPHVRLATSFSYPGGSMDGKVELHPLADGILDELQVDRSDWEGMAVGICTSLVGEQSTQAINCPPWPF